MYAKESCMDHEIMEPKSFFIDKNASNSKVANMF